jgi:hypothetical protein
VAIGYGQNNGQKKEEKLGMKSREKSRAFLSKERGERVIEL